MKRLGAEGAGRMGTGLLDSSKTQRTTECFVKVQNAPIITFSAFFDMESWTAKFCPRL